MVLALAKMETTNIQCLNNDLAKTVLNDHLSPAKAGVN